MISETAKNIPMRSAVDMAFPMRLPFCLWLTNLRHGGKPKLLWFPNRIAGLVAAVEGGGVGGGVGGGGRGDKGVCEPELCAAGFEGDAGGALCPSARGGRCHLLWVPRPVRRRAQPRRSPRRLPGRALRHVRPRRPAPGRSLRLHL